MEQFKGRKGLAIAVALAVVLAIVAALTFSRCSSSEPVEAPSSAADSRAIALPEL